MNINIVTYALNNNISEQIENFIYNSSPRVNVINTKEVCELNQIFQQDAIHILIINPDNTKPDILNFLEEKNQHIAKVIIISSNEKDIFEFIKHNIYDYIIDTSEVNLILNRINRAISKISLELDFYLKEKPEIKYQKFIPISSTKKIEIIKLEDIVYFEADGRYTKLFLTNGVSKMASKNLGEFQVLLDPSVFCRIHHKFIINMDKLNTIIKSDGYYCEMINSKNLPVSKRRIADLNTVLNIGKQSF